MNYSKISIITVCQNSEKTIEKTINSVNEQSYNNIEHIIIDGLSKDKTCSIAKKTKKKDGIIISEIDKSAEEAMNKSLKVANGEIIFFLHADDFLSNKKIISKVMKLFNENVNIDIVYGNIKYFNHKKNKLTGRQFNPGPYIEGSYLKGWHAPHTAFFVKKKYYEKFGYFREDIKVSPDYEIMFRFQELHKLNSTYLNETITLMGTGGNSANIKNILVGNYYVIKSLFMHNQKVFIPLFLYRRLIPKVINKLLSFIKIIK